jgi:Holliday junction DNA helicase RuvA
MPVNGSAGPAGDAHDPAGEAWNALVSLGYKPAEATRLLKGVESGSTEERIRRALQSAAP